MYSVDLYARVRRACHVDGLSDSAAARLFGIDRKTVAKILTHSVPPGYRRTVAPVRPKLDGFTAIIDQTSGYNGRFFSAVQDNDAPITIVWDGQVISYDVWAILDGARNREAAETFLKFATSPEKMASFAELFPYGPTRRSAISRIGLHKQSRIPMRDHRKRPVWLTC